MNTKFAGRIRFLIVLLLTAACAAQTAPGYLQTGVPPNTTMLKIPLGFIHVITGNVHMEIPIASIPERGGDPFVVKFVYDTTIYTVIDGVGHLSSGSGNGWHLAEGNSISTGNVQYDSVGSNCPDPAYPYGNATKYQNFRYVDGNNTVHAVNNPNIYTYQISCQDSYGNKDPNTGTPTSFTAGDSDGEGYTFKVTSWSQVAMTDVHGNLLNELYNYGQGGRDTNGNITTGTDTLGRTPVSASGYCNSTASWTFNVHDSSGNTQTYTVTCGKYYAINNGWTTPGSFYAPSGIVYPDGTRYSFSYDSGSTGTHYGNLTGVTLREGGLVSFAHTYGYPTSSTSATFGGGTWTLSYVQSGSGSTTKTTTTVTAPLRYDVASHSSVNDKTVYTSVLGGQPFVAGAQFYSGSTTLVKTVSVTYGGAETSFPMTVTTTLNDSGQTSKLAYQYGVGLVSLPTQIQEWDWGAGTPTRTQKISYGTLNRPASVSLYAGDGSSGSPVSETTYAYDEYGASYCGLSNVTGATNHDDTNYGYSNWTRGNPTTISRLISGSTWSTTHRCYDTLGNMIEEIDAKGNATTYSPGEAWVDTTCIPSGTLTHGYIVNVMNAESHYRRLTYYSCTGLVASTSDQDGPPTDYTYDIFGRPSSVSYPDGGQSAWSYSGAVSSTETTAITGSASLVRTTVLDTWGGVSQTQLNSDPDGVDYVDTMYDALGNKASVSNPHRSSSSSTDGTASYNYDALGRVTLITQPDGSKISYSYSGNTTTVTDEAGSQLKTTTDAFGRITSVVEDPSSLDYQTVYQYDVLGDLTCVEQHGSATGQSGCASPPSSDSTSAWRVRRFNYDGLSRLVSTSSPESGSISYTYDGNGNLLSKTAPQANQAGTATTTTTYCYDVINRLVGKAYTAQPCPLTSPAVSYYYDQGTYNGLDITFGIGRRTGMSDASGLTAWSYDSMGRVLTEQRTLNGITKSVGYKYNLDSSLNTLTYPDGMVLNYTYNSAAQPTSAYYTDIDPSNDINYVSGVHYAPTGAMGQASFGSVQGGFAGITGQLSFNNRLQPIQVFYTTGALLSSQQLQTASCPTTVGTLMHRTYNFNWGTSDNGNVISIANCRDANRTQDFVYDHLNRINQAYTSGPNWGEAFNVDAWGNLTNKGPISGKTNYESLAAPATIKNQLTGFSYDAAGNLTNDAINGYIYDSENRISSVAGVTYTYDGDGKRVEKSSGKLYWTGTGSDPLEESDLSGNFAAEYIYFNGKRVARHDLTAGPSGMALVQVSSATPQTNQSSVSVTFPSAQAAGNLNVVAVGWNDTTSSVTSVNDSNGNGGGSSSPGTATLVQKVGNASCAGTSATCSVTVAATGAGHLLVASAAWPGAFSIASVSGGGTWVCPTAAVGKDGSTLGSAMCYVPSGSAGTTTITVTSSAVPNGGWTIEFREYNPTASISFDTAGNVDDSTNCTSCSGVPLTLNGTNDLIVQLVNPTGSVTAVSSGWETPTFPDPTTLVLLTRFRLLAEQLRPGLLAMGKPRGRLWPSS